MWFLWNNWTLFGFSSLWKDNYPADQYTFTVSLYFFSFSTCFGSFNLPWNHITGSLVYFLFCIQCSLNCSIMAIEIIAWSNADSFCLLAKDWPCFLCIIPTYFRKCFRAEKDTTYFYIAAVLSFFLRTSLNIQTLNMRTQTVLSMPVRLTWLSCTLRVYLLDIGCHNFS